MSDPRSTRRTARRRLDASHSQGEKLFEFYLERDHARWPCELRNHGVYGVEAQFWQSEEFVYS